MAKIAFDIDTPLPPEKVTAMFLDFSDKRPETWPGLAADAYEVYEVGDTWAEIREGNKQPRVWARERYDWSKPGVISWTVVESNFSRPGSHLEAYVRPGPNGGTRLHVDWERWPSSLMGRVALALIVLTRGAPVKASMVAAFKKAEKA